MVSIRCYLGSLKGQLGGAGGRANQQALILTALQAAGWQNGRLADGRHLNPKIQIPIG